jgi:hypothetical protein
VNDPVTFRYLHAADAALKEARRQLALALDSTRDNNDRELRVLFALNDREDAQGNLRRALKRLEFDNKMRAA